LLYLLPVHTNLPLPCDVLQLHIFVILYFLLTPLVWTICLSQIHKCKQHMLYIVFVMKPTELFSNTNIDHIKIIQFCQSKSEDLKKGVFQANTKL